MNDEDYAALESFIESRGGVYYPDGNLTPMAKAINMVLLETSQGTQIIPKQVNQ